MGVGAKMAKGAVVRSRSAFSGTSTRCTPIPPRARRRGGGCCFSSFGAPIWCLEGCCASLLSPSPLAHVWRGLRASWPAPGQGREGGRSGEVWGQERGSVVGVR